MSDIVRRKYWSYLRWLEHRRKKKWQAKSNPSRLSRPVFLVGHERSGSTMTWCILGRLWAVDVYNSSDKRAFRIDYLRDDETIKRIIHKSYAQVVLFQSLRDTYRLRTLLNTFSYAKGYFLYRHFSDVVNSMSRMAPPYLKQHSENHRNTFMLSLKSNELSEKLKTIVRNLNHSAIDTQSFWALSWFLRNSIYFDQELDRDHRVKLIQYEAFVLYPEREFRAVCDFLGVAIRHDVVKDIYASSIKKNVPPKIDPEIFNACKELWERLCAANKEAG